MSPRFAHKIFCFTVLLVLAAFQLSPVAGQSDSADSRPLQPHLATPDGSKVAVFDNTSSSDMFGDGQTGI